jgi:hypothetical protein
MSQWRYWRARHCLSGAADSSEDEWREQAMFSIRQFQVSPYTSESMMQQFANYFTKNVPLEVRQNMCKVLNQCENGARCVTNLTTPLGYKCECARGYFAYNCNFSQLT